MAFHKINHFTLVIRHLGRYILIYVTPENLEIIDQLGFLESPNSYPREFLEFLNFHSRNRILFANPPLSYCHDSGLTLCKHYCAIRQTCNTFCKALNALKKISK